MSYFFTIFCYNISYNFKFGMPMYIKNFFFLLFIIASSLYFFSSIQPEVTLEICGSMCYSELSLTYIQLTSMITSAIALILFILTNYYAQKTMLKEKEKIASDRLNIEQIHAELEALKH
ncbi:MAG: Unknown protein [uncultured Sulfurovum sp.]|uniref:Uncharacterized protein n=1 Tax=uncultured Sulfurovum sp. TaxID=269237 RepID=A0A6S6SJT6_9BACT|nr:MAG: Unknown protein [uncultured Sulfurovum sp.]